MRVYTRRGGGGGGGGGGGRASFRIEICFPKIVGFLDGHNVSRLDILDSYKSATC